jgi:uncharacterized iron-regulated membrane protein
MRRLRFRAAMVFVHRWVGLAMAAFLVLEGVTGSVLAFEAPIDRWLAPASFASPPHPGAAPLSLSALAIGFEQREPRARVGYFSIDGGRATLAVLPRADAATGRPYRLGFDHVIVDPWTGRELLRQRYGDLAQGPVNFVPFLYELHQNLALGPWGTILLGVVAVVWTLDCFLAVYLTLPVSWGRFLARWKTAWAIKWPTSGFRFTFDLHRATGLWLWAALFVFAWSSVMLTLPAQVYGPVNGLLFNYRSDAQTFALMDRRRPEPNPRIGWREAERLGAGYMAAAAAKHGFAIVRPYGMAYIPEWAVYTYAVASPANVQASSWGASLWLDGDTGQLVELDLPAGQPTGNAVDAWLRALHFGDLQDALAYRAFVCALGVLVTALTVTGVLIWLRKRSGRIAHRRNAERAPARAAVSVVARRPP